MSDTRDQLLALIGSEETLSEAQVGELAVAADLILSQGSSDVYAALVEIKRAIVQGSGPLGYVAAFDPGTHVHLAGEFTLDDSGHGHTELEIDFHHMRATHVLPRYLRVFDRAGNETGDASVMLVLDGEYQLPSEWPLAELSRGGPYTLPRWYRRDPDGKQDPLRTGQHHGFVVQIVRGRPGATIRAEMILEWVDDPSPWGSRRR